MSQTDTMPKIRTRLRDATLYALQNRPAKLSLKQISAETGLPESWLSMFHTGNIDDPSSNRMETLYEYLNGKPIELA